MKNPNKQIVMLLLICTLTSLCLADISSAQGTVVMAEASATQPHVGDTLTVTIKISNVQNLFGIDLTLSWNTSVLKVIDATPQLGVESHSDGVLHESTDYPIQIENNDASQSTGEYKLLATATGSSTPSFTGSGTIAILTFNVTSAGPTGLSVESELSDKSTPGGTANFISHTDTVDSVDALIPEYPSITIIAMLIVLATAAIIASTKFLKKTPAGTFSTKRFCFSRTVKTNGP
jgi:hypothetical protein